MNVESMEQKKHLGDPATPSDPSAVASLRPSDQGLQAPNALALLAIAVLLGACGPSEKRRWVVGVDYYIPDSLRTEVAKCMASTMSGASYHLTTVDYEDVDDALSMAASACEQAYTFKRTALCWEYVGQPNYAQHCIDAEAMTASQKIMLDSLLSH